MTATIRAARWGADDLTVRYGAKLALDGVRLEVPDGRITMVVGGDGAGKTTLLRALAGAVRPSGGGVRRPPALRVGYVSAGPGVYRDLTVDENLAFSGGAYGLRGQRLAGRADELLRRTGLLAARGRLGGQLSGGMRQKLALAMALLHEPDLLVLDEPTTGVDPVSRTELWRLLAHAAAGGAAVVLSTVYLDEAARAAGVLVLDEGRTLLAGPPGELVAATPGAVLDAPARPDGAEARGRASWRRGPRWRLWSADGSGLGAGAERVAPDLEDAVIVASLERRRDAEWKEVAA
jgi:ABC-2 type transport system ATP-binding protein